VTKKRVVITDYVDYRARTRGFDVNDIESIVKHTEERYFDVETHRLVAIGRSNEKLVVIPYEESDEVCTPVTVHAVTRKQIRFRVNTGRFVYE
jgi:hypothetical protein